MKTNTIAKNADSNHTNGSHSAEPNGHSHPNGSRSHLLNLEPESVGQRDDSTSNFKLQTSNSHSRVGKIARLPLDIREYVNQSLRGGHTYRMIAADLEKMGHPGISERNISNWKLGGYVDWLQREQQLEARLSTAKALERCTRSGEIDRIQQNALALAADQLTFIMAQFDHDRALHVLYQKPELFPKYVAALGSLARCASDLGKAFDASQTRETALRQQHPNASDAASPSHLNGETVSPTDDSRIQAINRLPLLPLPPGEGKGEGEGAIRMPKCDLPDLAATLPLRKDEPSELLPSTFQNRLEFQPTEANGK